MTAGAGDDVVLARRALAARLARAGRRTGGALFGVAVVVFLVGYFAGFDDLVARVVIVALVAGSVLLAPAIVVGFAVRAAEREDRDGGRSRR